MSLVLYYSNYCNHSNNLIKKISHISLTNKIDFICINKKKIQNNKTYIILDNGQEILLPSAIQKVPALLLLINDLKSQIFYGDDIINYLNPQKVENTREDIKNILEPETFTFGGNNLSISSDSFSFLNSENQKNNYVNVNYNNEMKQIHQNYDPSNTDQKINQADIDKYIQQRDTDIQTSDNKMLQNI